MTEEKDVDRIVSAIDAFTNAIHCLTQAVIISWPKIKNFTNESDETLDEKPLTDKEAIEEAQNTNNDDRCLALYLGDPMCTRQKGHSGKHIACARTFVISRW